MIEGANIGTSNADDPSYRYLHQFQRGKRSLD